MLSRFTQYYSGRITVTCSAGVISSSVVNSPVRSEQFSVITDVKSKPADRTVIHPHEFTKIVGSTHWYGDVQSFTNPSNWSVTRGPMAFVYNPAFTVPTGYSNEVYNQALSRLYDKIRGQVDLAVSAAEAHRTLGLVKDLQRQVTRAFRAVIGFRRAVGKTIFNSVPEIGSKGWLTWQYGVRPVIRDVYNAADNLRGVILGGVWVKARASGRDSRTGKRVPNFLSVQDNLMELYHEYSWQRCELGVLFRIPDEAVLQWADWTSFNPINVTWELVPYSFVIDWFVDIGGYLRNMESAMLYRSTFVKGYRVDGYRLGYRSGVNGYAKTTPPGYRRYNVNGAKTTSAKRRTVLSGLPTPERPSFKIELGWQRLVSAASLIYQGKSKFR